MCSFSIVLNPRRSDALFCRSYEKMRVRHEPLTLIAPQFETPLPALQAAVFPPSFRELPPPALELYDLDEQFSTESARLAQLANKCTSSLQNTK